jgi:hypothetical protein
MCAARNATVTITLTTQFKITFLSLVALTALAMILGCAMFFARPDIKPGTPEFGMIEALSSTWKLGFGTVVGMIAGKAM